MATDPRAIPTNAPARELSPGAIIRQQLIEVAAGWADTIDPAELAELHGELNQVRAQLADARSTIDAQAAAIRELQELFRECALEDLRAPKSRRKA